jgi:hypothetical protein
MTEACAECGTRLSEQEFAYRDQPLCCECMAAVCSWFLDGGFLTDPDMFAHLGATARE